MASIDALIKRAVNPRQLKPDGQYTLPRSFGVYRLMAEGNVGRRFRFGNHPVRMEELIRDYGECEIEGIFLDRPDAALLTTHLNSK